jgi:hypothetical protein
MCLWIVKIIKWITLLTLSLIPCILMTHQLVMVQVFVCLFVRLYRRRVELEALHCFQVPRPEGGSLSEGAPKRKEWAREGTILLHC